MLCYTLFYNAMSFVGKKIKKKLKKLFSTSLVESTEAKETFNNEIYNYSVVFTKEKSTCNNNRRFLSIQLM